ncbi:MAG: hypothetical protein ACJ8C4_21735 [Gemmataceae bacterium]
MANFVHINVATDKLPTGVIGLPGAKSHDINGRYESTMTVSGRVAGKFRLSIFPDNMNVKGRIRDGTYPIFLGFHNPKKPTESDLAVRTNGMRAVIVINANLPVLVKSNDPKKTTSTGIHFHNGWYGWTEGISMSEGCLLVHPSDWERFIKLFLKAYPTLAEWSVKGGWVGQAIGFAIISSTV